MTVLVHELMHQTGQRFNAAITGADDYTRQRFTHEYERPLYREAKLLPPTTAAGAHNRAPLVFRFTTESRGGVFGSGDPQRTLLSFFDTAGEDLRSEQSIEQNVRYLGAADGILLLLDPLQMRGARELAKPGTRLPTPDGPDDEPAKVLERPAPLSAHAHHGEVGGCVDDDLEPQRLAVELHRATDARDREGEPVQVNVDGHGAWYTQSPGCRRDGGAIELKRRPT